jgi:hypothetical protein
MTNGFVERSEDREINDTPWNRAGEAIDLSV